jgi:membrane protein YqaA with SNARE-associated domain
MAENVGRRSKMKSTLRAVFQELAVLWVLLSEFPTALLRSLCVIAGWLRLNDCLLDEGCILAQSAG